MQSESTQSTKNTSLIDEIYDEILLKEAEAKNKKYNENNYINDGASLVINGKKVYRASEKNKKKRKDLVGIIILRAEIKREKRL